MHKYVIPCRGLKRLKKNKKLNSAFVPVQFAFSSNNVPDFPDVPSLTLTATTMDINKVNVQDGPQ